MSGLRKKFVTALVMVALAQVVQSSGWAQQDSSVGQPSSGAAPAATGPDTTTQTIENPPISGLDTPSFEPSFGARSYLLLKAHVSDAVDTNPVGGFGSKTVVLDAIRGLGGVTLQKLWKVHPLAIDYIGGANSYTGKKGKTYQTHAMAAEQRFLWRTGQLALRDSFSYLPQGSFGASSFGGAGVFGGGMSGLGVGVTSGGGIAGGGGNGVFGVGQFGSVGNQPRITNMGIADITQALSPRASVVVAGGYGITDFINNPAGYINSNMTVGQAGYNYQLTRHDQVAATYAFQEFHFPQLGAGSFNVNSWQGLYGHRISGKLDLTFGGGPQWIRAFTTGIGIKSYFSGAGRISLMYHVSSRTNMTLGYSHHTSPGSGFFAGANTDSIRYAWNHSLTRRLTVMTDAGYSRNSRILKVTSKTANNAGTYTFWYAGGALHYALTRQFSAIASYQFDNFNFRAGFCPTGSPNCARGYDRHVGLIGINWIPRPIRLD